MQDIKALAQRSKEALDRIQKEVQAKRMSLDAALGHAFIAGTEHMAELRKTQKSANEHVTSLAVATKLLVRFRRDDSAPQNLIDDTDTFLKTQSSVIWDEDAGRYFNIECGDYVDTEVSR